MSQTATELKTEIRKSVALMRTLSDEVRVKLHLAGMDAKDEWKKIEPRLAEIERAAEDLTDATRLAVNDTIARLDKILTSLTS